MHYNGFRKSIKAILLLGHFGHLFALDAGLVAQLFGGKASLLHALSIERYRD